MWKRLLWGCCIAIATGAAAAADYPSRPIRVVVPFSAGSASDLLARMIGPKLLEAWGQQVVIDNRPSAGGTIAGAMVASAAPDGYTLMVTSSAFAGSAALYDKLPYDPVKDFAGVCQIVTTPLILVVGAGSPIKSTKDLIAAAQQKPGQLNYGSSGIGSGTHYAGELFKVAAKIDTVHVPYRGVPEALTDVMSGRIHFAFSPVLVAMPLVRSGRILALGATSTQRIGIAPEIPTIAESALPGFVYDGWFGVFAPARTPRPLVTKLYKEVERIMALPDVADRIAREGSTAKTLPPEQFDRMVHAEIVTRGKIFKGTAKVQ